MSSDCHDSNPAGDPNPGNGTDEKRPERRRPAATAADRGKFSLEELTELERSSHFDLIRPCDVRGILHAHSRYTDGAHPLASLIDTAEEIGLEYLGISDHFQSEYHPEGLDLDGVRDQRKELDQLRRRHSKFDILQGIELDAAPDGSLPLADDLLAIFDYVIVAFPEAQKSDPDQLTRRIVGAATHPQVTILGPPVGNFMLRPACGGLDMDLILEAALTGRTAVEVSAHPDSPTPDWEYCRKAQDLGLFLVISPNAHRAARLVDYRHGANLMCDAGLRCGHILNTMTSSRLRDYLSSWPDF